MGVRQEAEAAPGSQLTPAQRAPARPMASCLPPPLLGHLVHSGLSLWLPPALSPPGSPCPSCHKLDPYCPS